jgi:hypothetical protein
LAAEPVQGKSKDTKGDGTRKQVVPLLQKQAEVWTFFSSKGALPCRNFKS